jgi:hypothetical protein
MIHKGVQKRTKGRGTLRKGGVPGKLQGSVKPLGVAQGLVQGQQRICIASYPVAEARSLPEKPFHPDCLPCPFCRLSVLNIPKDLQETGEYVSTTLVTLIESSTTQTSPPALLAPLFLHL